MLIPRYSLQTTLKIFTVCAVFFLIMGRAYQGDFWAVVITVAVISIFATLAVHALFYFLVVTFGKYVGAEIAPARTSQGGVQTSTADPVATELEGTSKSANL